MHVLDEDYFFWWWWGCGGGGVGLGGRGLKQPFCLSFRRRTRAGYYCVLLCLLWCSSPFLTFSPGLFGLVLIKKGGLELATISILK